jgi:hypothetical protein
MPRVNAPHDREEWEYEILAELRKSGEYGIWAANYIISNNINLEFHAYDSFIEKLFLSHVAGGWANENGQSVIHLNSNLYNSTSVAGEDWAIATVAHEATHLDQGELLAASVLGELEAWQVTYRLLEDRKAYDLIDSDALRNLNKLPLVNDQFILHAAKGYMFLYAGPTYFSWALPLSPTLGY